MQEFGDITALLIFQVLRAGRHFLFLRADVGFSSSKISQFSSDVKYVDSQLTTNQLFPYFLHGRPSRLSWWAWVFAGQTVVFALYKLWKSSIPPPSAWEEAGLGNTNLTTLRPKQPGYEDSILDQRKINFKYALRECSRSPFPFLRELFAGVLPFSS